MGIASSTTNHADTAIMPQVKPLVHRLIAQNAVMVFSKSHCSFSQQAKSALTKKKIVFEAIELDNVKNGRAMQDYLQELTNQRTVPNVFANGYHIGGCDDTLSKLASGELEKLLKKADKGEFALLDEPKEAESAKSTSTPEPVAAEKAHI